MMAKPQKQGKMPKGIQTTTETVSLADTPKMGIPKNEKEFIKTIISADTKAVPEQTPNSGRFLFDGQQNSEAPRNVYRETVNLQNGETNEYVWWHCENGAYVGRIELKRQDPKTEESRLVGYDYLILATKDNLQKVANMATSRTMFYKMYQTETLKVDKDKFVV